MKQPTLKLDRLRELREANYDRAKSKTREALAALKEKVATVPAKKPPKAKRPGRS